MMQGCIVRSAGCIAHSAPREMSGAGVHNCLLSCALRDPSLHRTRPGARSVSSRLKIDAY